MYNIRNKIRDKAILDSEIIQEMESVKKIPGFDINYLLQDISNWSLLIIAVWRDRKELVEYLLSIPGININNRSLGGNTVLYECKQVSILKLLLDRRDIDVNIQNNCGNTGLHGLCCRGIKHVLKELLLDSRVNTYIRDGWGMTARDIALRNKDYNIAKIVGNAGYTTLLRIPNEVLLYDIVRMIIEEYT